MENNNNIPSVVLHIDKERRWQLDLPAFERACEGFEELGMQAFAENPLLSLSELKPAEEGKMFKMNTKISRVLRVWLWAGFTGEDPGLSLKDFSKKLTIGKLPGWTIQIFPALTESLVGNPTQATEETLAVAAGASPESA